jgi:hypothetical protein
MAATRRRSTARSIGCADRDRALACPNSGARGRDRIRSAHSYLGVPTIGLVLWLTLLGRSTGHALLRVDLAIDRGTSSQRMIDAAAAEAAAVWARYGVDVRLVDCASSSAVRVIRLNVVVVPHRGADTQEGSIGAIEFASDTPRPYVSLYVDDVEQLVKATLGDAVRAWPAAEHDDMDGRALGRALAHEIGHFLLRSRQHARSGLMRATHPIPELIARDRRSFTVSSQEIARIAILQAALLDRSNRFTARVTSDRNSSQSNSSVVALAIGGTTTYE